MTVSDEMVENGAAAIHACEYDESYPFDRESNGAKELLRKQARACLTAALSDQVVVPNPAAQFVMWAMLTGSWQGDDIDGGAAQDKAVELGLIVETTYDPIIHGESVYCSPGDIWYVPSEKLLAMLPAPASTAGEGK